MKKHDWEYEPRTFKEGAALVVLFAIFCASIYIGARFGGYFWIIPILGIPASLYGMWRVGGWER